MRSILARGGRLDCLRQAEVLIEAISSKGSSLSKPFVKAVLPAGCHFLLLLLVMAAVVPEHHDPLLGYGA